jgi:hypothetical protein
MFALHRHDGHLSEFTRDDFKRVVAVVMKCVRANNEESFSEPSTLRLRVLPKRMATSTIARAQWAAHRTPIVASISETAAGNVDARRSA